MPSPFSWPLTLLRRLAGRARSVFGASSPSVAWVMRDSGRDHEETSPGEWCVEARFPADGVPAARAEAFFGRQTLDELRVVGTWRDGREAYRFARFGATAPARFVFAPGEALAGEDLGELDPTFLETAFLTLASLEVDGVILGEEVDPETLSPGAMPSRGRLLVDLESPAFRVADAPSSPLVERADTPLRLHVVGADGVVQPDAEGLEPQPTRRGSLVADRSLRGRVEIGVRDASRFARRPPTPAESAGSARRPLLVTAPFLARGGAEHTLFETLRALGERWEPTFATLAPHRAELGDRREEFRALSPRILCLGDTVHPVAMPGQLASILDSLGACETRNEPPVWYNANGTTLFYDFLPEMRRRFPDLRVVDHLYDHRIGYIDRYDDPSLLDLVDAVVAENHRVQEALVERGWPAERAPVVWPCGRADDAFPAEADRDAVRRRRRAELGIDDETTVILVAARMHEQKRPLDLVRLAERTRDLDLAWLVVGGGDLETEVDRAIAGLRARHADTNIRRLAFRTDIPELIVAADAGCLVSQYEGLPVFLLECLQAGLPFLGTDVGELGRVLRETGAGWVIDEPGDLDALEAAARELADPRTQAERAEKARVAGPRFGVDACAERYERVLRGDSHSHSDSSS